MQATTPNQATQPQPDHFPEVDRAISKRSGMSERIEAALTVMTGAERSLHLRAQAKLKEIGKQVSAYASVLFSPDIDPNEKVAERKADDPGSATRFVNVDVDDTEITITKLKLRTSSPATLRAMLIAAIANNGDRLRTAEQIDKANIKTLRFGVYYLKPGSDAPLFQEIRDKTELARFIAGSITYHDYMIEPCGYTILPYSPDVSYEFVRVGDDYAGETVIPAPSVRLNWMGQQDLTPYGGKL